MEEAAGKDMHKNPLDTTVIKTKNEQEYDKDDSPEPKNVKMTSALNNVDMSSDEQNRPDRLELTRSEIGPHGTEEVKHKTDEDLVASPEEKKPSIAPNCTPCLSNEEEITAKVFCENCIEYLCSSCEACHKKFKATKSHKLNYDIIAKQECDPCNIYSTETYGSSLESKLNCEKPKEENKLIPGRPVLVEDPKADSVKLRWNSPKVLLPSHQYQIRYKSTAPSDKWKYYDAQFTENTVVLENMKSDTTFIFQVRMVNNEDEGPYSQRSDLITTKQSAANRLIDFTQVVSSDTAGVITKRKLLLEEIVGGRNSQAKTRKFYLGKPIPSGCREKTVLLVGATGSGKSTLVDGFINYILGVNWDDPFRFTLVDLEKEEEGILTNQAVSQTHWITTYSIYPMEGSRLDYKLNIIDTPGFGDTRGFERDQQIVDQIRQLFTGSGKTGVVFLDAICFLTKAPDARLTPTQGYIFNAILSLFGQDVAENINILVTFADGKAPPVLAALREAKLPVDVYFPFNNSGLFADNSGPLMSSLSPMYWEMGCRSFCSFFEHLRSMETKSLQQTKEVLTQRNHLEITIENLSPLIRNGLNKLDELREEIRILEQHKTEIKANKDFVYTVMETQQKKMPLPKGEHVTNCYHCNVTCHKKCKIAKDEDKHRCWAMDKNGNCTQCSDKCVWNLHANTPYIFKLIEERKVKTYADKLKKYRFARDEKMTHEKVIDRMWDELERLENNILVKMDTITKCNNVLKEIALRPNPLSVQEHINILIEAEKQEQRPGYQRRISSLLECRKKSSIGDDVERFRQDLINTRSHSTYLVRNTNTERNTLFGKITGYFLGKGQ